MANMTLDYFINEWEVDFSRCRGYLVSQGGAVEYTAQILENKESRNQTNKDWNKQNTEEKFSETLIHHFHQGSWKRMMDTGKQSEGLHKMNNWNEFVQRPQKWRDGYRNNRLGFTAIQDFKIFERYKYELHITAQTLLSDYQNVMQWKKLILFKTKWEMCIYVHASIVESWYMHVLYCICRTVLITSKVSHSKEHFVKWQLAAKYFPGVCHARATKRRELKNEPVLILNQC
jgi:hypothetical protein